MRKGRYSTFLTVVIGVVTILIVVLGLMFIGPRYRVWSQSMAGQAELKRAEFNRRIAVEEAVAARDAAMALAEAEIERAKGVAEANRIIGDSLAGNDDYIRYLWVQGLNDGSSEVIYIPTEANLPILEAGRLGRIAGEEGNE